MEKSVLKRPEDFTEEEWLKMGEGEKTRYIIARRMNPVEVIEVEGKSEAEKIAIFIESLQRLGSVKKVIEYMGIKKMQPYYWEDKYPDVAEAMSKNRELNRRQAIDWMDDVISGKEKVYNREQSGLAIWRASGGRTGQKVMKVEVITLGKEIDSRVELEIHTGGEIDNK